MCAICAGITVRVEGSIFLQGKHHGCGSVNLYTKSLHWGQLIKLMCRGNKSNSSWSLSNAAWDYQHLFDIKDLRSTAKVKQKRNTHGFNSTHPLTDADGTYETWGISLTDRAASNKNVGGIAHWLTNEIVNYLSETGIQCYRQRFKVGVRERKTQSKGPEDHDH